MKDKPNRRKYFVGTKKLKHVKLFENFDQLNEVKASAVADRKLRVTKDFAKKVDEMLELSKKFETMHEEYEAMSKLLGKYEEDVQKVLEGYGAQFLRIGKIAIQLKTIAGKETKSYKEISTALEKLIPVNAEMKKKIKDVYEINTKINPDKVKMVYSVEEGWLSNMAKAVGDWFTNLWSRLKGDLPKFEKSVDELEAATDKLATA